MLTVLYERGLNQICQERKQKGRINMLLVPLLVWKER